MTQDFYRVRKEDIRKEHDQAFRNYNDDLEEMVLSS